MNNIDIEITKIDEALKAHVDKAYLEKAKVLIPSDRLLLGVRVPKIRELSKHYYQTNKLDFDDVIILLDQLFERQIREEMLFGIFLLQKYKKYFSKELFDKIDNWIEYIENWEICDQLATVAGEIVSQNNALFQQLGQWTTSRNFWRRRFVLATGSSLNHKGRSYVKEVLNLCNSLMRDQATMVQKAIPWAIREASKKDAAQAFKFLMKWKTKTKNSIIKASAEKLTNQMKIDLSN